MQLQSIPGQLSATRSRLDLRMTTSVRLPPNSPMRPTLFREAVLTPVSALELALIHPSFKAQNGLFPMVV